MAFEVDRDDLHRTRVVDDPDAPLPPGAARLRVDAFALTANNITYAVVGDMLQYWTFFPPARDGEPRTWGRIPVWGFGEVVESTVDDVAVGRRVYGYLPMATELVVEAGRVDGRGITDTSAHRRTMAGTYNRYTFTDADPVYDAAREAYQMVCWPLFFTSFLIDDFLVDQAMFGAPTVIVTSASSKTAIGVAFMGAARTGVRIIGLTSARNADFVRSLGCYDTTITYDELSTLPPGDAVLVDVAGNRDVAAAVHGRYGGRLRHSMVVGNTHWDHHTDVALPEGGPPPTFFFAPTQIAKRTDEWGQAGLDERVGAAWRRYTDWAASWIRFERHDGAAAVERVYRMLLDARIDPRIGYVCSMHER